ncbi:acyltransferase [Massilia sp. IC2-476]|uniref:acyltransferase family protein n=1 Tax=Massilia sp. IC2-476 TaxID=2887199 RepID=UPI001D0F6BF3|nr:acyltransferase [Massilia sp. IC2-476]MCC2972203.1 acyltransferase [Massilia sp. IC2-476]
MSNMHLSPLLQQRISLLRFLMIFGVVLLHTPPYVRLEDVGTGPFDFVVALCQHAIFRTSVPVLTFISAYLLFRAGLDLRPVELLRKKSRSLLLPYLVFNLGVLAGFLLVREMLGVTTPAVSHTGLAGWLNVAFGLAGPPINYPLNFLRDLLVLMLLAPLFGYLLRKTPFLGLILVLLVFYNNLDGPLVMRDVMGPVFYLGGLAAVLKWDMEALDRFAPALLAVFFACCAAVVYFKIINTNYLRLVAPVLVWPAASLLVPTAFGQWLARMGKYSFFLFLAHAPILVGVNLLYRRFGDVVPYPLYWIMAPVIVTLIVVGLYALAMRSMPGIFCTLIGKGRPAEISSDKAVPAIHPAHELGDVVKV